MSMVIVQHFDARCEVRTPLDSTALHRAARRHRSVSQARLFAAAVRWLGAFFRRAYVTLQQRSHARAIYSTLSQLDARTLRDLGFDRSEIGSVAAELAGTAELTRTHAIRAAR